jgi:hypothetical protein
MKLHDIFREEGFKSKFDKEVYFEQYGSESIDMLVEKEPGMFFEIGGQAWMRFQASGTKVDPQKLYKDFRSANPLVYRKVEKIIKRKIIQEISFSYAYVRDDNLENNECCQLLLFRLWPNELFISDVAFSNPYKPVSVSEKQYPYHEFRGLGLFASHLEKMIEYCQIHRVAKISLTTATNSQIPYFEKHGFIVENSDFSKEAFKLGQGVPMYYKCT